MPNPADPQDFNRYSYTRNNPLKYVDPSGHRTCGPNANPLDETCDENMDNPGYGDDGPNAGDYDPPQGIWLPDTEAMAAYCEVVGCGGFDLADLAIGVVGPVIAVDKAIANWMIDHTPAWYRRQLMGIPLLANAVLEALPKLSKGVGWRIDYSAVAGPGLDWNGELFCWFGAGDCEVISTASAQVSTGIGAGFTTGPVLALPFNGSSAVPPYVAGVDVPLPLGFAGETDMTLTANEAFLFYGIGRSTEIAVYTALPQQTWVVWNAEPIDFLFQFWFGRGED